ncbi:glycosyltransferase [Pseudomonas mangiferae]|uniref:Glycosyltransferase n=1 Tax=Pseudomonas mangiferae TaxID=2593654 RepID=A0A553GW97_9PSED|nr:glycosyltransferase [Pseudomonas mangiferae]TRX73781.1 glycosyltransferase [Pseudomonas mangiferae]
MNILFVCDAIDPSQGGGTAERTFQMARALHRAGAHCMLFATDVGLGERRRTELQGIETLLVPSLSRRFFLPRVAPWRVAALVRRADVVQITGHWSWLGALAGTLAMLQGKPYVYCPAGSLRIFGRSARIKQLYNRLVGRRLVRRAACCITTTEQEREQFHVYGVPDDRIVLVPNGVDDELADAPQPRRARERYGLGDEPLLLFLGRLSPIKGPDLLLDAFAALRNRHPRARLLLAGPDSGQGAELRQQVERLGLEASVGFTGHLEAREKFDLLAAADLLAIPSRHEVMSLVVLEAGLVGTPALLTDQCGFDDVERVGAGRVVAANADALARGLEDLLDAAPSLPQRGERLRQLVLERYTWKSLTRQCLELFAQLTGKPIP